MAVAAIHEVVARARILNAEFASHAAHAPDSGKPERGGRCAIHLAVVKLGPSKKLKWRKRKIVMADDIGETNGAAPQP